MTCLWLSGGGAKGAYGAGVAKALDLYRKRRGIQTSMCYIGTSAGALNAYMLAAYGVEALVKFWSTISNLSVLGVQDTYGRTKTVFRLAQGWIARDSTFSFYSNAALEKVKGEQGVLICEPYKSELTPHWRFKNPEWRARVQQKFTIYSKRT